MASPVPDLGTDTRTRSPRAGGPDGASPAVSPPTMLSTLQQEDQPASPPAGTALGGSWHLGWGEGTDSCDRVVTGRPQEDASGVTFRGAQGSGGREQPAWGVAGAALGGQTSH